MSPNRVRVAPEMLNWALDRSRRSIEDAQGKFPKLLQWLDGEQYPTVNQFKDFAQWTRTPAPLMLLQNPPTIDLPITDFRVGRGAPPTRPSTELIDTIHLCQRRQAWFEEYLEDFEIPGFRSTRFRPGISELEAAGHLRTELSYNIPDRTKVRDGSAARSYLISAFEDLGGLIMINGVVGNNTSRRLDIGEFRGFTLNSPSAPLVFLNGTDTDNSQVFSLAHEFAHVWRGDTGVSSESFTDSSDNEVERWCNRVAAEFLVPAADLREQEFSTRTLDEDLRKLSRRYACSTLVIILRLRDLELLDRDFLSRYYARELGKLRDSATSEKSGGDFYRNQKYRIGSRFGKHLFRDTASGRTSFTDAMRLTSLSRTSLERFITGGRAH